MQAREPEVIRTHVSRRLKYYEYNSYAQLGPWRHHPRHDKEPPKLDDRPAHARACVAGTLRAAGHSLRRAIKLDEDRAHAIAGSRRDLDSRDGRAPARPELGPWGWPRARAKCGNSPHRPRRPPRPWPLSGTRLPVDRPNLPPKGLNAVSAASVHASLNIGHPT
jgi:hypothetical protein